MRSLLYLAASSLLVGCLVGCIYEVEPPRSEGASSAECASSTGSAESKATPDDEAEGDASPAEDANQKPYASLPREEGTFELVARFVLRSIPYRDCGTGGRGDLDITFMPNGSVQKIVVWAYAWSEPTKECVSQRFAIAHVAPFAGDARAVRWHAALEDRDGDKDGGWGS
jgi:hypothetical protein